jgi:pimeloyl-ACP methyl ester carboxylesterase
VGWPGFGPTPAHPAFQSFDDLVADVVRRIDRPTALIAQSMGGAVALRAALARPDLVTHLVLAATSGGLDVGSLGAVDWRAGFLVANPTLPTWFTTHREDLSAQVPSITAPALLLWGDTDPISPVAVGQRLVSLLPRAQLQVVAGGGHDLARVFAGQVAPWIDAHLLAV